MGMRGVREHYTLCWGDITMKTASNGLRYLEHNERQTKMRAGDVSDVKTTPHQMWEMPECPDRCPVILYLLRSALKK